MGLVVVGGTSLFVSHDGQAVKSDAGGASSQGTSGVVVVVVLLMARERHEFASPGGRFPCSHGTDKGNGERERERER